MGGDSQLMTTGGGIGLMRNVDSKHRGLGLIKLLYEQFYYIDLRQLKLIFDFL